MEILCNIIDVFTFVQQGLKWSKVTVFIYIKKKSCCPQTFELWCILEMYLVKPFISTASVILMFLCLTVAVKAARCQSGRSEKEKMVETLRCENPCPLMIWRGTRRYCSGWWRVRRKLDAIRGALTGEKPSSLLINVLHSLDLYTMKGWPLTIFSYSCVRNDAKL